jgi:predicted transglutaminase-like cysteine proteinase
MDYLLNIALSIVETILFFNPFTQLISNTIKKEREHSCDDWVLQFQYNAATYASALLQIAVLQNSPAIAMTAVNKKNDLLSRIRRMVDTKNNRFNYRNQLISLLLIIVVLFSVTWIVPQQKDIVTNSTKLKSTSLMIEPMAAKVSNPLFNPLFFFRKPLQDEIRKNLAQAETEITEASKGMDQMPAQVAAVMPVAMQALKSLQLEEESKQTIATEQKKLAQFIADTLKQNFVFTEKQFVQGWQLLGEEMKKTGTELEKKQFPSGLQNKQSVWLNEVNKTVNQFKQMQDVFKLKGYNLEQEISNAFREALSSKNIAKTIAVTKAEIAKNKRMIDSARIIESKRKRNSVQAEEPITENNYYKLAGAIPHFQYALNNATDIAIPVVTTSTINNEVVTCITIKAKNNDSSKINITPKRYEVVVSNTGKPDKKIIIEVL